MPLQDVLHQLLQGLPGGGSPVPAAPLHPVDCRTRQKKGRWLCSAPSIQPPKKSHTHPLPHFILQESNSKIPQEGGFGVPS